MTDDLNHPKHYDYARLGGHLFPSKPARCSWYMQWQRERACPKRGGHWWHPDDGMIGWFCCQCGKETEGMPEDGSSR